MPTCQAYKCTNTTGRTTKGKSFFKITEPKNATEGKKFCSSNIWSNKHELNCLLDFCLLLTYKVLLTRHVSENKRKRDAKKDHQQVSFISH